MAHFADQIAGIGRTQLDAFLKTAELAAESAHKLAEVQFEATKEAYADSVAALRKTQSTKEMGEIASLAAGSVRPVWDKTARYSKSIYGVLSAAQAQYAHLVEQQLAEFNKGVVLALDSAAKSAPAGSENVINVMKSGVHSANAWYETMVKTARQLAAATEANLTAAAAEATGAARKKAA